MEKFETQAKDIFNKNIKALAQKILSQTQQDFIEYVEYNGFVPIKQRSEYVALVLNLYKKLCFYRAQNYSFDPTQPTQFSLVLIPTVVVQALWVVCRYKHFGADSGLTL